jgi:cell division protein FtsN
MSPDRDSRRPADDLDMDDRDRGPRSLFSALWFRVLLAVLALGVVAAVAVPYVLDTQAIKNPLAKSTASPPTTTAPAAPATPTVPAATPASPAPEPSSTAAPPASSSPASSETAAPVAPAAPVTQAPSPPTARPTRPPAAKTTPTKPAAKSPTMVAKAGESPRSAPKAEALKAESPRAETATSKSKAEVAASKGDPSKASVSKAATGGKAFWVQVGAFKDPDTAKRVAARLREAGLRVEESTTAVGARVAAATSADRYDVVVSGASAADIDTKLAPKGLKGEATANGVVVRPSLALREAVALSRDLADAGFSVQVRRVGGGTASAPAPTAAAGQTLYRVRVGGFADRAGAVDAMKQLEDKGFKPFIARGNE